MMPNMYLITNIKKTSAFNMHLKGAIFETTCTNKPHIWAKQESIVNHVADNRTLHRSMKAPNFLAYYVSFLKPLNPFQRPLILEITKDLTVSSK